MKNNGHIQKRLKELHGKWKNNTISRQELFELQEWLKMNEDTTVIVPVEFATSEDEVRNRMLENIEDRQAAVVHMRRPRGWVRVAAASVVAILLTGSGYFMLQPPEMKEKERVVVSDGQPGQKRAILKLSDGSEIVLDTTRNGALSIGGTAHVMKSDGALAYTGSHNSTNAEVFNTIITPRGGQYQVVLPDGSRVWLNAASSIRFPTSFNGKERKVEVSGEAYFEVAAEAARPFRVISHNQMVDVLGTHFNINAYEDEPAIRTTLLEGSIRIRKGSLSLTIAPGQQTQVSSVGPILLTKDVNIEEATAWKNGYFVFNHEDIKSIMRKISRWYDMEIVYVGTVSDDWFAGTVSRYKNVSEVLSKLELSDQVHFKIAGKKIMVFP